LNPDAYGTQVVDANDPAAIQPSPSLPQTGARIVQGPGDTLYYEFHTNTVTYGTPRDVSGKRTGPRRVISRGRPRLHRERIFPGPGGTIVLLFGGVRFYLTYTSDRAGYFGAGAFSDKAKQALRSAGFTGVPILDDINILHGPFFDAGYRSPTENPSIQFAFPPLDNVPALGTFDVDDSNPTRDVGGHIWKDLIKKNVKRLFE
jgi:hypothetical protein